jgi:hypothetical protein
MNQKVKQEKKRADVRRAAVVRMRVRLTKKGPAGCSAGGANVFVPLEQGTTGRQ